MARLRGSRRSERQRSEFQAPPAPAPAAPPGGSSGNGRHGPRYVNDSPAGGAAEAPAANGPGLPHGGGRPLGELLLAGGALTSDELQHALLAQAQSGRRLGAELVALGVINDGQLAIALASQHGLPLSDLSQTTPSPEAVALLPEHVARDNAAIAVAIDDGTLVIAVADPAPDVQHRITQAVGRKVSFTVAPASDVRRAVDNSYRALSDVSRFVDAFQADVADRDVPEDTAMTKAGADAPVVRIVDMILTQALRDRASDIHIEPQGDRIDGALHEVLSLPGKIAPAVVSRLKIMAGMNIVERRRPQDGQIVTIIDGRELDLRVSTLSTIWGEKCVLRLLDKSKSLKRMADLGMPAEANDVLMKMIHSPFGMVLCAGPTGAGKTTTLYAGLQELNDPRRNIMTIEDPVEYVFPSINQIQTNEQTGLSFAQGLKSILRQDPDVILVGEIRDVDTARIAVQSALTGHTVLSSLHATDAVAALHRFLDMGIESFLIASSVVGIVGQRLVRRTCTSCTVTYHPSPEELAFYKDAGGKDKKEFFQGVGCNFCADTGYQDRIGVFEVLKITPEIRRLVVGWATQEELERVAVAQGMRTLQQEAIRLVEDDVTTIDEVLRSIYAV
jgi:type IV pilus assembly protein PilB